MKIRNLAQTCALTLLAISCVSAFPQAASARWSVHNDADVTQMTPPPGALENQTCTDRLVGETAFAESVSVSSGEDPALHSVPAIAFEGVAYDLWKAPPGFGNFREDDTTGEVLVDDGSGNSVPATLVVRFTTPARTALSPPIPLNGNPAVDDLFAFTKARFSVPLPSSVNAGDLLGMKPHSGGSTFLDLKAVRCLAPLPAQVDVRPASTANEVYPQLWQSLIPVRIFGSSRIDVRKLVRVRLGLALPASPPSGLGPTVKPKDVNNDGRLDRLYYFRTWRTGIVCGQASTDVTGKSAGKAFTATRPITTVNCPS